MKEAVSKEYVLIDRKVYVRNGNDPVMVLHTPELVGILNSYEAKLAKYEKALKRAKVGPVKVVSTGASTETN